MSAKKSWRKFNFKEWRSDQDLSRVSREARSFWLDLCGLIYEAEDRGRLSLKGKPYSIDDLAAVLGDDRRVVKRLLAELEAAQVFDRDSENFITSRRILREEVAGDFFQKCGRSGGNPALNNKAEALSPLKPKNQRPEPEQEKKKKEDLFAEPVGFRKRCKQAAGASLKPQTKQFQLIIDLLAKGWTEEDIASGIASVADGKSPATIGTWKYFAVALENRRAEAAVKPIASKQPDEAMPREQGEIVAIWTTIKSETGQPVARMHRETGAIATLKFKPFDGDLPPEVERALASAETA